MLTIKSETTRRFSSAMIASLAVGLSLSLVAGASSARAQELAAPTPDAAPFVPPEFHAPTTEEVARQDLSAVNGIDEEHPERSIPAPEDAMKNPLQMGYLVMDLVARGEAAIQRGDHASVVRYFKAVAKAVPDRAISHMKICRAYRELEQFPEAIEACKAGLARGGATADDHAYFVRLLLAREQLPDAEEREDITAVLKHLELELGVERPAKMRVAQLRCEVATRLEDEGGLETCTRELGQLAPKDPQTFSYSWALALKQHDFDRALKIAEDAEKSGIPRAAIQAMEEGVAREASKIPGWLRFLSQWRVPAGVALAATLAVAFALARKKELTRASV